MALTPSHSNKLAQNWDWQDLKVGQSAEFTVDLNQSLVKSFLKLSGDFNPLHADADYARQTSFGKIVVPGMMLASFFSRLVGMYLPGQQALYLSQNLSFKNPAFVNDEVRVKGVISHLSEPLKLLTLELSISEVCHHQTLVIGEGKVLWRN